MNKSEYNLPIVTLLELVFILSYSFIMIYFEFMKLKFVILLLKYYKYYHK